MSNERSFYVYFMTNYSCRVLYIGVTNNVERRVWEHRQGVGSEFAKKYHVNRVVYVEEYQQRWKPLRARNSLRGGSAFGRMHLLSKPIRGGKT
jgi:putative endonuclease